MKHRLRFEPLEARRLLAVGDLLTSFGSEGVVREGIPNDVTTSDYGIEAVARGDGGVFVAGSVVSGRGFGAVVVSYEPDGSIDREFGDNGFAKVPLLSGREVLTSVTRGPDGKLLLAGWVRDSTLQATSRITLARLNADGTADDTFGTNGLVYTNLPFHAGAYDVLVRPNGKIVAYASQFNELNVVQYLPNGSLDESFGSGGVSSIPMSDNTPGEAVLLADGSVIIVSAERLDQNSFDALIYKIDAAGSLDTTFGDQGVLRIAVARQLTQNPSTVSYSLTQTADGNIVFAGTHILADEFGFLAVKFDESGVLDSDFGDQGSSVFETAGGRGTATHDVVAVGNRIVLSGVIADGNGIVTMFIGADGALERTVRPDISIDTRFDGSSVVVQDEVFFVASRASDPEDILIYASKADGQGASDFGNDGLVTTNVYSQIVNTIAFGSIELPNQQLIVGLADQFSDGRSLTSRYFLTRYRPNGDIDSSYGSGGQLFLGDYLRTEILQPQFVSVGDENFLFFMLERDVTIVKLTATGELDLSFGLQGQLTLDVNNQWTKADLLISEDAFYLAGPHSGFGELPAALEVQKFDRSGAPEVEFGDDSIIRIPSRRSFSGTNITLAVHGDGIVALVGNHLDDLAFQVGLTRFSQSDGSIDSSFGVDGLTMTSLTTGASLDNRRRVVVLPGLEILVLGNSGQGNSGNPIIQKFNPDGSLDTTFGSSGSVSLPESLDTNMPLDLAIDSAGRIVAAVSGTNAEKLTQVTVVRLTSAGAFDSEFSSDGVATYPFDRFDESIVDVAIASLDDIMISGSEVGSIDRQSIVARIIGSPGDPSWNNSSLPSDVNGDGFVSPLDALLVINFLNRSEQSLLPSPKPRVEHYYDVTNDGFATPLDALIVINELNNPATGESEPSGAGEWSVPPVDYWFQDLCDVWGRRKWA